MLQQEEGGRIFATLEVNLLEGGEDGSLLNLRLNGRRFWR